MSSFIFWSILLTQQRADWRKPHVDVSGPVKRMWTEDKVMETDTNIPTQYKIRRKMPSLSSSSELTAVLLKSLPHLFR